MEVSGGVGVVEKGEGVAGRLGDALVAPAFAADGYVAVVATDFHLCTLVYEVAVGVDAGVDDSLVAARTG